MGFRWTLSDPATGEFYTFEINPKDGGSLPLQKNLTYYASVADDSVTVFYEGRDQPQAVSVSGTLLSQDQYEAMVYWYSKRRQVLLTDDLGRQMWVYFTQFQPTRKWTYSHPWRHDWTANFYVFGQQAVTAR